MEDTLRGSVQLKKVRHTVVLILVLMEDTLRELEMVVANGGKQQS